jgi:hypothetical protein
MPVAGPPRDPETDEYPPPPTLRDAVKVLATYIAAAAVAIFFFWAIQKALF